MDGGEEESVDWEEEGGGGREIKDVQENVRRESESEMGRDEIF